MKGLISFALKLTVTGFLLYVVLKYLQDSHLRAVLGEANFWWLGVAIFLTILQAGLAAARWKEVLLRLKGIVLPVWLAFAWNGTSTLIGQILPSTVGGDAFRVGALAAESDLSSGLRAVLADRIIGLVALGMIVVVAGTSLIVVSRSPTAWVPFVIGLAGCLGCVLIVLAGPHVPDGQRILRPVKIVSGDMRIILTSPNKVATLSLMSILIHLLSIVTFATLARALNLHDVALFHLGMVVPCALLISAVPISLGGWGLREGAMYIGFKLVGSDPAAAIVLSLMFGVANLAVATMGALLWLATKAEALQQR
jgi:glycosyltransferase 2 family protein